MNKPAHRPPSDESARSTSMLESVRDKLGLLNRSIKLDRSEGKVRVSFEAERSNAAPKGAAAALPASDAKRLRDELKALLNRCPGAREVLPHLAGVEQALKAQGLAAFDSLPPRVLQRAATQLESVLGEPVSSAIAELRSRLGVALKNHEKAELAASRRAAPSSFLVDEKLQVSEASVSDFMKVMEESKQRP